VLKDKVFAVIGFGISGLGAISFLKDIGARVIASDFGCTEQVKQNAVKLKSEGVDVEIGSHTESFLKKADIFIISPGVPRNSIVWDIARRNGIICMGEIELGFRFCKAKIIAITGTNGKSTTTMLIGHILLSAGFDAFVCGNIEKSFCENVLKMNEKSIAVLEISSFQLSSIREFKPNVAVILNITQNHLDYHQDINDYVNSKKRIFSNQDDKDTLILNYDDPILKNISGVKPHILWFSRSYPASDALFKDNEIFSFNNKICSKNDIPLPGQHNISNVLAACLAVSGYVNDVDMIKNSIKSFKGLEHRLEYVAQSKGVRYINDSKSTTVDSLTYAIESIQGNIVLIAGGRDKGLDFGVAAPYIRERVKTAILIGEAAEKIKTAWDGSCKIIMEQTLESAVAMAKKIAIVGDTVLLSPCCTSFDSFENFEQRGNEFKKMVLRQ
jgi:UDP-N-acetylmuramoylalanine--D-glutamate ligase